MCEFTLTECTRQNTCFDCDDERCGHHGSKKADCPKYHCDNEPDHDCDHCEFIDNHIRGMRTFYELQERGWNDNEQV